MVHWSIRDISLAWFPGARAATSGTIPVSTPTSSTRTCVLLSRSTPAYERFAENVTQNGCDDIIYKVSLFYIQDLFFSFHEISCFDLRYICSRKEVVVRHGSCLTCCAFSSLSVGKVRLNTFRVSNGARKET